MAATRKISIPLAIVVVIMIALVGGIWTLAIAVGAGQTEEQVQRKIEAHEKATHEGTERALERLRKDMQIGHAELKRLLIKE